MRARTWYLTLRCTVVSVVRISPHESIDTCMSKFPENVVQYTDVTRGEYSHRVNEYTAIVISS